jgi:hypothetical protein
MSDQDVAVQRTPRVGDGATISFISDCYPATVVAINKTGKVIVVQRDIYTVTGGSVLDGSARYVINPNSEGALEFVTPKRDGTYRTEGGQYVTFGRRRVYRDPSF